MNNIAAASSWRNSHDHDEACEACVQAEKDHTAAIYGEFESAMLRGENVLVDIIRQAMDCIKMSKRSND